MISPFNRRGPAANCGRASNHLWERKQAPSLSQQPFRRTRPGRISGKD